MTCSPDDGGEWRAVEILHHDEGTIVVLHDFHHLHHVRVVHLRCELGFAAKQRAHLGVCAELGVQHLQHHELSNARRQALCQIDLGHAAAAQLEQLSESATRVSLIESYPVHPLPTRYHGEFDSGSVHTALCSTLIASAAVT